MEPSNISIAYPIYLLPGSRFYNDKDNLNLNYTNDHPQRILSTKEFPECDIDEATNLSIWVQVLIKYYPAISKFFYYLCRNKEEDERIALMEYWIKEIDGEVSDDRRSDRASPLIEGSENKSHDQRAECPRPMGSLLRDMHTAEEY